MSADPAAHYSTHLAHSLLESENVLPAHAEHVGIDPFAEDLLILMLRISQEQSSWTPNARTLDARRNAPSE